MKRIINSSFLKIVALILLGLCLSAYFYNNKTKELPGHIHAWTQSDRYALALGFTENGHNLFLPQTYNLRPDLEKDLAVEKGITPVDFPIHEFNISIFMSILNNNSPQIFRLYFILFGIIGLVFLCFFISRKTQIIWGVFLFIFIFTCPVFTYYLNGFMPTITALSSFFIGLSFYANYLESSKYKYYILGFAFLLLAALTRTPFFIVLVAFSIFQAFTFYKNRKINWKEFLIIGACFFLFFAYFLYNLYLTKKYGSAFLNKFLPASSFKELKEIIHLALNHWKFDYFTVFHYLILLFVACYAAYYLLKHRTLTNLQKGLLGIGILNLGGALLFSLLMAQQFVYHDYYFYDIFFPIVTIFLFFGLSIIPKTTSTKKNIFIAIILLLLSFLLIKTSYKKQDERNTINVDDRVDITTKNFQGSAQFLDSLKIPRTAKILVYEAYTTNLSLIQMKRYGYTIISTIPSQMKKALTWKFDYIVIQNDFLVSEVLKDYPEIMTKIERIANNGKVSVYKLLKHPQKVSLFEFLKIDSLKPVIVSKVNFDSIPDPYWQNIKNSPTKINNIFVGEVNENDEFGITFSLKNEPLLLSYDFLVQFECSLFSAKKITGGKLITSVEENGSFIHYNSFDLNKLYPNNNEWKQIKTILSFPRNKSTNTELKIYFYNIGKEHFYYDNLKVSVYSIGKN